MAYAITCLLRRFDGLESSTRVTNFENGIRTNPGPEEPGHDEIQELPYQVKPLAE